MEIGNVKADVNLVLNLREAERHRRYFDCFINEKLLYRKFIGMSETSLKEDEVTLGGVKETIEEECSDNKHVLEICRKRKRSDEEEEEVVEEENDGFKTPTRPENRIPKVTECPPAPRKGEYLYLSGMLRGKTMYCRRRLSFSPEDDVSSFITDLRWRTTTMTIKK
ncbi:cyclin-dependent protein kinase inhibitor SMR12 [Arabidopsis lyrata subsp. lyrata]|uniref:cyclin-dependent protein kinase inhibitor SMR12 n=1 Tax=Arabidopsis lyrata subsp. lyrata TaxID=81972 RepID=UPI000A29E98B|nr:cyclin-dependent protein kinase inhibitor SMR12 [Arabidopsis lyrata subsp. lyrata]|eukprot:XP_020885011.1 cyclin-dependent protein kinase inhibitor SMR12 [Arabidopsis lyrata subsp. lyrata]